MKSRYPVQPFDRSADGYDQSVASAKGFPHEGYEEVLSLIVRRADAQVGMRVLDLGIGTGNLAERFIGIGCHVWGIDFSSRMLEKAAERAPTAVLVQADVVDEWPVEVQRQFDRVVSSYALHHFDLDTKAELLCRVFGQFLVEDGAVAVGDVSFPTAAAREKARPALGKAWDEEEFYWAADETIETLREKGVQADYTQVSSCGGVYVFRRA